LEILEIGANADFLSDIWITLWRIFHRALVMSRYSYIQPLFRRSPGSRTSPPWSRIRQCLWRRHRSCKVHISMFSTHIQQPDTSSRSSPIIRSSRPSAIRTSACSRPSLPASSPFRLGSLGKLSRTSSALHHRWRRHKAGSLRTGTRVQCPCHGSDRSTSRPRTRIPRTSSAWWWPASCSCWRSRTWFFFGLGFVWCSPFFA